MTRCIHCALMGSLFIGSFARAQDPVPMIFPASDEGQNAIAGFTVPAGMQVKLFAAEPLLANPVAFGIDEQGRVFVCESFRQNKGVEDNRRHMNWLEADLAAQTVADRLAMYRQFLEPGLAAVSTQPDRLRLLVDTDGDGVADKSTLFSEDFHAPLDGTGAGVLSYNGNVYYTCIPDLFLFKDSNQDGVADEKVSLHTGFGVRVAFSGHDMHGLIIGPDGRLYFSIGDRGFHVVTKEGKTLHMPDRGAVFRCELDGSNLEVFASGLRNPQELAFDDFGNLFTGDNNSDGGDQARWVYVVEGGETGWRMYYQYLGDRGPWTRERLWYPYRADETTAAVQPAYIVPPVSWLGNGPSGLVYYPGLGLDAKYAGHFFMADFRGSPANSGIRSFAVEPEGASFKLIDSEWFLQTMLMTDVDFGYDGKIYTSDWVNGWPGEGKGRIYTFTDPAHQGDRRIAETVSLMKNGFAGMTDQQVAGLLGHADRRVRQRAQFELVNRKATTELLFATGPRSARIARIHALWGLGQMLRAGTEAGGRVTEMLLEGDEEICAQALRIIGDCRHQEAYELVRQKVRTGSPRLQSLAAIALGKLGRPESVPALIGLLRSNADESPVLRHAAVMGLIGSASAEQLADMRNDESASVRLGLVVALRRLESPLIANFLADSDPRVVTEAATAIHDLEISAAREALSAVPVTSDSPDALLRRVLAANYELGQPANALRIAEIAAAQNMPAAIRLNAIKLLSQWGSPPNLDPVTNRYHPLPARSQDVAAEAVKAKLPGMLVGSPEILTAALELAGTYKVTSLASQLNAIFGDAAAQPSTRREAFAALVAIDSGDLGGLIAKAVEDSDATVRAAGLAVLTQRDFEAALPRLRKAIFEGAIPEAQTAASLLGTLRRDAADALLAEVLDAQLAGSLRPELWLEVREAAAERPRDAIVARVERLEAARNADDPLSLWRAALAGGDAERGEAIFKTSAAASCRRCHKVNGDGGDVGPDLSGVALNNPREHLLESIVNPNAKIAKGFETVTYGLENGQVVSGIIRQQTDDTVSLMPPDGKLITVRKSQIEQTAAGKSGMPEDVTKLITARDIRDLVAYLATLQKPAPATAEPR